VPHIGHGYTTVAVDMLARWHRQAGDDTWMLTGTDEHGQKMLRAAAANGATPQEWVDKLVAEAWHPLLKTLDVENDDFIRTTQERHEERVQKFVQAIYDRGYIYAGEFEALYCVGCEEFKTESEIVDGTGPFEGLKVCAIHSKPLELLQEKNYFFKLSEFQDALIDLYTNVHDFVRPDSARNEVLSFVKNGLKDLSISRSTFDWGIKVPWDESHIIYVWVDALLNYATAIGYGADEAEFARRWPGYHVVGKDILRFHAVIWPAMLMAAGLEVPKGVVAHGWLLVGGEKMSKTAANQIAPADLVSEFGVDGFRYHFLRDQHFGPDGDISYEAMVTRYNADLANNFGNLANRVLNMATSYCGGLVPTAREDGPLAGAAAQAFTTLTDAMTRLEFSNGFGAVWDFIRATNSYIEERQPWALNKAGDNAATATVLGDCLEALRIVALLASPLIPRATEELWRRLGYSTAVTGERFPDAAAWGRLPAGATLDKGAPLFPRIESERTVAEPGIPAEQ